MSVYEQAFAYHVKGYNIIPVAPDKKPAISSWKKWQTEEQSDELITDWFSENVHANVGIITGNLSNLTVVDIDTKNGQKQADHMLAKFPETYTVQTPSGGYHLYYAYQKGLTVSANAYPQYPNVDIRSEGGYVVAPPSVTDKGEYTVIKNIDIAVFPIALFPDKKLKRTLTEQTTANKGQRNDTLASFAGKLLQASPEDQWESEVWPAVERANKTYTPPLPAKEVRQIFDSILKKEKQRRADLIISPFQLADGQEVPATAIKLRKNSANMPYKDMANVMIVLSAHPFYQNTIRYNTFRHEIEYNNKPLEDADLSKIQHFMQASAGLPSIGKEAVFSAIVNYAQQNSYDEAQDWLKVLVWDGTERLATWLIEATGVADNAYHRGVGSQWFFGMIRRIMDPGCIFDYMLVLTGAQGLGKTSMFRIIGGPWYKSYTGGIDSKDFYLALRGGIIIDLDEGATLYKSEAIKIKSIITETHDEFRAPYERIMKKYPRRFVFSMSTNDDEPFRDITGNRRYWPIDLPKQMVNFKWLEDNREQLFAEAYHCYTNGIPMAEVPQEEALRIQELHLPQDSWTELVVREVAKSADYCEGKPEYSITAKEVFENIFPNDSLLRFDRRQEMKITAIFKKHLGLEKAQKMIDNQRSVRWYLTDTKRSELQSFNMPRNTSDDF